MKRLGFALSAAATLLLSACGEPAGVDNAEITEPTTPLTTPDAAGPVTEQTAAVCSTYGTIDRDADSRIARTEYDTFGDTVFADWDSDDDNRVSEAEFSRCWSAGGFHQNNVGAPAAPFQAFDANDDGYLDENEFFGEAAWSAWDTNRDNALADNELFGRGETGATTPPTGGATNTP